MILGNFPKLHKAGVFNVFQGKDPLRDRDMEQGIAMYSETFKIIIIGITFTNNWNGILKIYIATNIIYIY